MQQPSASFWSDIKELEERLTRNPDSYLFARLAELYLQANLVDDALHTARKGVTKFPAYVAGQRALAMVCHAKGLAEEYRCALEAVTSACPEDADSQKKLARLLSESGDRDAAQKVYHVVSEFYPEDEECFKELQALEQPSAQMILTDGGGLAVREEAFVEISGASDEIGVEYDEIIDLTDDDVLMEEVEEPVSPAPIRYDPLSTVTLAELYIQQGFTAKALEIYRALNAEDPANEKVSSRIAELEQTELEAETTPITAAAPAVEPPALSVDVPAYGRADEVIATLEGWLDTIRRIKACR